MESRFKKVLTCFFALIMFFAICSVKLEAQEPVTVGTFADLQTAVNDSNNAGGTITLQGSSDFSSIDSLVIAQDITIDLNGNSISPFDNYDENADGTYVLAEENEAAVIVNGCSVTIKNGSISTGSTNNKTVIIVKNGGKVVFEDVYCNGYLVTKNDAENNSENNITIKGGTYSLYDDTGCVDVFKISNGTVKIYSGSFKTEVPEAYLAEDVVCDYVPSGGDYVVRSGIMSEEFKKAIPDGGLVISAVKPKVDTEGTTYIEGALAKYGTDSCSFFAVCIDLEDDIYDISYSNENTGEYETHRMTVKFEGSVSDATVAKAEALVANLPTDEFDLPSIYMSDMEIINMWANGFNPNNSSSVTCMSNYSLELKKCMENANIDIKYTSAQAGDNNPFYNMGSGNVVLQFEDVGCGYIEFFTACAGNVVYVPSNTATDTSSLMKAAQDRIDSYLGEKGKVSLTYGGEFATFYGSSQEFTPEEEREMIIETLGLETAPTYYFTATVGSQNFNLFIIPDSSKMLNPKCKTVDVDTKIIIETEAPTVPLDANIRSRKLTGGAEYDAIVEKLGVDNALTYDLKLYSCSNEKYLTDKLVDDSFTVYIPITEELKEIDLSAYYVDENGKIEEYPVEVIDGFGKFKTSHFSVYTLAKASVKVCDIHGAAHKLTAVPAKNATTTAEGNKAYWTCDCGKWFADADGKVEIINKQSVIIPKLKDTQVVPGDNAQETDATNPSKNANDKNTVKSPGTGDSTDLVLLFGLLAVTGAAIIALKKAKQ